MKKIYFLALFLFGFQSCSFVQDKVLINEEINSQLKNEIKKLNKELLHIAISNDSETMRKKINSESSTNSEGESFEDFFKKMHEHIKNDEYAILDEYYIQNSSVGDFDTLQSGDKGINSYKLFYPKKAKEMFVSLLLIDSFDEKILLTVMYSKLITGWKIDVLHIGGYTKGKKTAPEWYIDSKKDFGKEHLISSGNKVLLALSILQPASEYIEYDLKKEIETYYRTLLTEIKISYPLPFTLKEIETQPILINFSPEIVDSNYCPIVEYLSKIDIKDTVKLKEENNHLHAMIEEVFKGISKDNEHIAYKVRNRLPKGEFDKVEGYGFYRKNK